MRKPQKFSTADDLRYTVTLNNTIHHHHFWILCLKPYVHYASTNTICHNICSVILLETSNQLVIHTRMIKKLKILKVSRD